MVKNGIILILLLLLIPVTAHAASLYLKDGGIIRCIFAKQQNGTVYVLVNRDTEIELDRRIVALTKTFKNRKMIGAFRPTTEALRQRQPE